MARCSLYLESAPGDACMAHAAELPGCYVLAPDEERALAAMPAAIARHQRWRHAHGIPGLGEGAVELLVCQVVTGPRPWTANGAGALFSLDRSLLTDAEFELHLRILACARADLLRAAHTAPRGIFDESVPGQGRTLRQTLSRLADSEEWLLSRIGRVVRVSEPDPLRRLVDVRAHTIDRLLRCDREDRDLVFLPTIRPSDDPEELWTLRKLFRRLIEQELEHLADVEATVAYWTDGTGYE